MPGQATCPGIALSGAGPGPGWNPRPSVIEVGEPGTGRHRRTEVPTTRTTASSASLAAVLVLTLAGCARPENGDTVSARQEPSATPASSAGEPATAPPGRPSSVAPSGRTTPPLSSTDLPTLRPPSGPPERPTDLRRTDLLAGRISRGGSGPCYGLVTDDGREYALHGENMGTWGTGTWVRVTIGPPTGGADCGPGIRADLLKISPVG